MAICDLCSGSGRDIITPATKKCPKCLGSGQVFEGVHSPRGEIGGIGIIFLALFGLFLVICVLAGYIVSSKMVWHSWTHGSWRENNWGQVALYAGASFLLVASAARLCGLLAGIAVGLIPAIPLIYATKGHVGFWFIAFGDEGPSGNVASSWIALIGMVAIHGGVAWIVQRPDELFSQRLLRWNYIKSSRGTIAAVAIAGVGLAAWLVIRHALNEF